MWLQSDPFDGIDTRYSKVFFFLDGFKSLQNYDLKKIIFSSLQFQ